ncbi:MULTISPECIES: LTA synthase family protein [unclassified Pseudoalteromonas]|uniref:LTA synthase family protein n=1 Tax=unclassified Pseudoalteromonas TaxID=194690 RepID=UPI0016023F4A|nr:MULTISPECIES: LTA synthase family protein [unclassified Pseudoalteromonas]MBB1332784.1 LTA synthase family protein [Pseudoalteromonas sp. SR41-6]MBB1458985.1 LTA synthase family protein [Pseudoalteromonas sp. SG41-8]MBB1478899.1 LTA synthase family protein [Pseudoalteromonas sp. SG41-2]
MGITDKFSLAQLQNRLGPYWVLLTFFSLSLTMLTLARFSLSVWQGERVFSSHAWLNIFVGGLRVDTATLSYILMPALLLIIISTLVSKQQLIRGIIKYYLLLMTALLIFFEVITATFISEYDLRPNRLFIEYLIYPKEVSRMIFAGYKIEVFTTLLFLIVGVKLATKVFTSQWRSHCQLPIIKHSLLVISLLCLTVLGARNSLGHRPLNPAMVAFSTDHLLNDLSLNSLYSVAFAIKQLSNEKSSQDFYGTMAEEELLALVRASMQNEQAVFNDASAPTKTFHQAAYQGKPKNLVIILQESLGARYVGTLGGLPLTPNIDKLYQRGWGFDNLYATGTRSVRGIEAVITGFTPTPSRAVVKLDKSQRDFFTIADFLSKQDYQTQFIYGGESHFDNMQSFFLGNGFQHIVDSNDFANIDFNGSWGASDEDLYNQADIELTKLQQQGQPFFSLVFSSSNHSPYEFPDNKIALYDNEKQTRNNAAKYADYALGTFIEKAKQSSYWDDTVFIVIADHDSRVSGASLVPIDHFRIPAVIFGKGINAKRDHQLASQLDIPTTLLSLIGASGEHPMIGRDLTQPIADNKQRAMMQYDKNFAYITGNSGQGNKVVILQPQKPATTYIYTQDKLVPTSNDPQLVKKALAHANLGNLAYQKSWYH